MEEQKRINRVGEQQQDIRVGSFRPCSSTKALNKQLEAAVNNFIGSLEVCQRPKATTTTTKMPSQEKAIQNSKELL